MSFEGDKQNFEQENHKPSMEEFKLKIEGKLKDEFFQGKNRQEQGLLADRSGDLARLYGLGNRAMHGVIENSQVLSKAKFFHRRVY